MSTNLQRKQIRSLNKTNFFGFAFSFRQEEINECDARYCAAGEDEKCHVVAQLDQHVGEETDNRQGDKQIERRRQRSQHGPILRREHFAHDDQRDVAHAAGVGDKENDEGNERHPAEKFRGRSFTPNPLEVEECSHGCQGDGCDGSRTQQENPSTVAIHQESGSDGKDQLNTTDDDGGVATLDAASGRLEDADGVKYHGVDAGGLLEEHDAQ
ncbi:Uncharacterized protein APZ42_024329 [Daphnia magna]|uniref:Uncharacterized protein n=1 Tax=Daphnia magna TaxID=35525 RepID=A0A164UMW2_9CRUS|nr:Uncharacterized protein APZ42_024329 [Daphnia magna]